MGEVYRARDTKLNRDVALKVLPEIFALDADRLARFKREAQVLASLDHPNIGAIYGFEDSEGVQALVLQLVEGPTLADRVAQGPMSIEEALPIARQIAEALEAAHEKGVIHRDLKPANIKVTVDGHVKVLDFGLAKLLDRDGAISGRGAESARLTNSPTITSPAMTQMGIILGTAAYMSPEQAKGRAVDKRTDIWAFGCVLYEMLTGRRAFEGEDVSDTLAFILTREPDWNALSANMPAPIHRLLRRALQKDRSRRFESAADSRLEIDDALTSGPVDVSRPTNRRAPWIAAAAATLVLGALTGAWVMSLFRQPHVEEQVLRVRIEPPPDGQFVLGGAGLTVGTIALSPDAKAVAYLARVNGKTALWVRPLDASAAIQLPGTEGASFPMWAPDSQSLAFFAQRNLDRNLARIQLAGGRPVTIFDAPTRTPLGTFTRGGTWSNDGSILFGSMTTGLLRVSASGGMPTAVTMLDAARGEQSHENPQILPGGRVLFAVLGNTSETSGTYATSFANPAERIKVLDDPGALYAPANDGTDYLIWQRGETLMAQRFDPVALKTEGETHVLATEPDGARLLLSVSGDLLVYGLARSLSQLNWVDRAGKLLSAVGEPGHNFMFRISPDDRNVLIQDSRSRDLWLLDTTRGLRSRFTARTRSVDSHPLWSPNGSVILFANLGGDLFRKPANGASGEELVTQRRRTAFPTDWSGDGRWVIVYEVDPETKLDLWILPVTPDGKLREDVKPRPYARTPFNERFGRFSPGPTPRWVAYQSDESGRYEVYIDAFPEPRGKIRLSTAGGTFPQWRADGRELFYISPDYKLMAVSLKEAGNSIEPAAPHELFAISAPGTYMSPYEVTRDGQRFLVLSAQEEVSQSLTMIVNWPKLLKKGAGGP